MDERKLETNVLGNILKENENNWKKYLCNRCYMRDVLVQSFINKTGKTFWII